MAVSIASKTKRPKRKFAVTLAPEKVCYWTICLPEPKGRSYGELDILFARKVPARKFKGTEVDPYRSEEIYPILQAGRDSDDEKSNKAYLA